MNPARAARHPVLVVLAALACLPAIAQEGSAAPPPGTPPVAAPDDRAAVSLVDTLQGQDGVTVRTMCTNCNEASIDLGGLGDAHVDMTLDGFKLAGGLPRIFALSILPAEALAKVDVAVGPGRAQDSYEATGGTLRVRGLLPGPRPTLVASTQAGSYGWRKAALLAGGALGPFSALVAGTRSSSDDVNANGDRFVETGRTRQWTASGELRWQGGRAGRAILGFARIRDDQFDGHGPLYRDGTDPAGYLPEDTLVDWRWSRAGYDLPLGENHVLRLRASQVDREQRIRDPDSPGAAQKIERYVIDQRLRLGELSWHGSFGTDWSVSAGWTSEDDRNTASGDGMPFDQPVLEEFVKGWAGFAQATVALHRRASLTVGARYDAFRWTPYTPVFDVFGLSASPSSGEQWNPRAELSWKVVDALLVKAALGRGYRPPRPVFNEICCGQYPERNRYVRPESSWNASVDAVYQPGPAFRAELLLGRSTFDDYLLEMVGGSVDLHQKLMNANIERATVETWQLGLTWNAPRGVAVKATYGRVDARNDGSTVTLHPNVWDPVDLAWPVTLPLGRIPYVARSRGSLEVRVDPPARPFHGMVRAQYTGSMPIQHYDDVPFSTFPPVFPPGGLRTDYVDTPGFWIVNVSGGVDLGKHWSLPFGVDNVFDEVQSDLGVFTRDYNWGAIRGRYAWAALTYRY